ncbi:XRE family transcriptional regulator [Levilactobacillus yiduensis]|uniref:XRE family transcriptional regulator n=1 Tax=Levilactobacillus yiduensis TaxID=2953880 RepID=UPI0021585E44|nr:XRE family transcriptional regulator [Levilactobacillus yiduensis]
MYSTIQKFAKKRHVPISRIESDLGFANGSIRKWETADSISLKKAKSVAEYLHIDPYTLILAGVDMERIDSER